MLKIILVVLNPAARWQPSQGSHSFVENKLGGTSNWLRSAVSIRRNDDQLKSSTCLDELPAAGNDLRRKPQVSDSERHHSANDSRKNGFFEAMPNPVAALRDAFGNPHTIKEELGLDKDCSQTAQLVSERRASSLGVPYRVDRRTRVTDALQYMNIGAFALINARAKSGLFELLAKSDAAIRQGQLYRLVTPVFLHASIPHLLFNTLSLRQIGDTLEPHLGAGRFAMIYLAGGVAGNAFSYCIGNSPLAVGASGAIFGLMGCWLASLKVNEDYWRARGLRVDDAMNHVAYVCGINFVLGMGPGSRIDNMCHLGGFVGGGLAGLAIGPRLSVKWLPNGRGIVFDKPLLRLPDLGQNSGEQNRRRRQFSSMKSSDAARMPVI